MTGIYFIFNCIAGFYILFTIGALLYFGLWLIIFKEPENRSVKQDYKTRKDWNNL